MMKRFRNYIFTILLVLSCFFVSGQGKPLKLISVAPSYSYIASQFIIHQPTLELGFGLFNRNRFYFQPTVGLARGFSNNEPPDNRKTIYNAVYPGVKLKWILIGSNQYRSLKYMENSRFCLDFGAFYHFNFTEAYRSDELVESELNPVLGLQLGFSMLIPYTPLMKNTMKFFNKSDLYLEVCESFLVDNDISLFYNSGSNLANFTYETKVSLNLVYYLKYRSD